MKVVGYSSQLVIRMLLALVVWMGFAVLFYHIGWTDGLNLTKIAIMTGLPMVVLYMIDMAWFKKIIRDSEYTDGPEDPSFAFGRYLFSKEN